MRSIPVDRYPIDDQTPIPHIVDDAVTAETHHPTLPPASQKAMTEEEGKPLCRPVHVVVVAGATADPTASRLHWLLSNNPDVSACTVLSVIGRRRKADASDTGRTQGDGRTFRLDRLLVTEATLVGALQATLEPVYQRGDVALVVRIERIERIERDGEDDEVGCPSSVEAMALSYGFECLRVETAPSSRRHDDVVRDVVRVAGEVTAWFVRSGVGVGDGGGGDVTLVAASRKRLVQLSPHLPLSRYLLHDVEAELAEVPCFASGALVKASDFMLRMEASDGRADGDGDGDGGGDGAFGAVVTVFSEAFERFRAASREIPWADSLPAMSPVFDRFAMNDLLTAIADGMRDDEAGAAFTVGTVRSWPIVGDESDLSDLTYPCLLKSRVACGVADSHQMALVLREEGLEELEMEGQLVAQEFVNHGGLMFKVYVARGGHGVVQRESLPDVATVTDDMPSVIEFDSLHGLPTRLPWMSSGAARAVEATGETANAAETAETAEAFRVPDGEFLGRLVAVAREVVGLSVFGFDVIVRDVVRDGIAAREALVVDVNYLPRLFDGWDMTTTTA